jgi:hypothetical protein
LIIALVALVVVSTACSSGSDRDPVVSPIATAGFLPDEPNPGSDTVTAGEGEIGGNLVTVDINVTDTIGMYGAAFDLNYDPSGANYVDFTEGNLFEQGGHTPFYLVEEPQNGQLVVVVTRVGNVPGVNASGTQTAISLTFEVIQEGNSIVSFDLAASQLLDDQAQPLPIPNINWFGGSLTGSN